MDFIGLGLVIFAVAFVIALLSGDVGRWAREEWRLMWADEFMPRRHGISGGSLKKPGREATREERDAYARALDVDARQRFKAEEMQREGRHLDNSKRYIPVLTKPAEPPPPKAGKVYPIRKPTRINRGD